MKNLGIDIVELCSVYLGKDYQSSVTAVLGVCVRVCVCVYTHIRICMRAFVWGCVGDIYGKVGRVQSQDLEC